MSQDSPKDQLIKVHSEEAFDGFEETMALLRPQWCLRFRALCPGESHHWLLASGLLPR
jgi:hypothetical protein